jgi:SAM-dependent methyltransferase
MSNRFLSPRDLERITDLTLEDYNQHAESFWRGTRDHDVSQNIDALLSYVTADPPFTILDFGCGPGRDLKVFADRGHTAVGLEGAAHFAEMARAWSGCEVWQQDFLRLDLPADRFDGVFANATLFHVPSQELPRVLRQIHACLKPGGALLSSIPHGDDREGWSNGRWGVFHHPETWRRQVSAAGFTELTHYYRPDGQPRDQQPWFASVWRRS